MSIIETRDVKDDFKGELTKKHYVTNTNFKKIVC